MAKRVFIPIYPLFIPIVKRLYQEGFEIFTGDIRFSEQLKNLDILSKPIQECASPVVRDTAYAWAGHVVSSLNTILPPLLNGMPMPSVEWLKKFAYPFYYPRLAEPAMITLALDEIKPDVILLHNDVEPVTRVLALWARARGKACIHVPHAVYQDINRTPTGTDVHDLITATHIAVGGEFQQKWFEERNRKARAGIHATGLPQFDKWATRQPMEQVKARRALNVAIDSRPVVTYVSTWGQGTNLMGITDEYQVNYLAFLDVAKQLGLQIIVKCHPRASRDNWQWHADQAKAAGVTCSVTPEHLEFAIDACDLFFAYGGSNSILEASFNPGVRLMTTHGYVGDEAVWHTDPVNVETIKASIVAALSEPPRHSAALRHKYLGLCDGLAWERIAAWAKELAG